MVDTKVSALAAATTLADTDVLPIVNGGVSKNISLNAITTYIESRGRRTNASVANQAFTTAELYVTGSNVGIPTGRLQPASMYRMRMQLTKTSTTGSTSAPIVNIRVGTAGTIADTTRLTLTFAAQTAVADAGFIDIYVTFRTVGASTVLQGAGLLDHQLATTGLANVNTSTPRATGAAFDVTTATFIGCTFNGGTSFAGNTDLVQSELMNLA
jgi:hypothetical protein